MSSCLFSFSFIGHNLAKIKICHNEVHVLNFLVTFLLLTTNTALYFSLLTVEKVSRFSAADPSQKSGKLIGLICDNAVDSGRNQKRHFILAVDGPDKQVGVVVNAIFRYVSQFHIPFDNPPENSAAIECHGRISEVGATSTIQYSLLDTVYGR